MSSEKRLILFTVVTFASILALQYGMEATGLIPPPPKKPLAQVAGAGAGKDAAADRPAARDGATPALELPADPFVKAGPPDEIKPPAVEKAAPRGPVVALAAPDELVLGSSENTGPGGYRLRVRLDQKGAGVASVTSALYEAEFPEGQKGKARHKPLELLKNDPKSPPSLAITLVTPRDPSVDPAEAAAAGVGANASEAGELPLDYQVWEVVRGEGRSAVSPVTRPAPAGAAGKKTDATRGQQVVFRTRVDSLGLTLTRTYRLFPGEDGFDAELTFESPEKANSVVYKLLGPHGIPIEGEWYTGTFRDAVFGTVEGTGTTVKTLSAYDIAKRGKDNPERLQFPKPLKYAGVENQYFAALVEPWPAPRTDDDRRDAEAVPLVLHDDLVNRQKSDIGVELTSRSVRVGPNVPVTHAYRVFAGPKTVEALEPFGARDLATYRKSNWIPFATYFSSTVITPLLGATYEFTRTVSRAFGGRTGNYGVAIILLTMLVRMAMFPLGRKQAILAKRMQDLQPLMKELQEKYKDDKETLAKETWALQRRHGVNPVAGCLPALIQLPIFVGLWQALNNSVHLRHASFLYIENLAAPDMLFKFPVEVPFLGNYFNVLPFLVVALMLVQTKLFSPPATTPEAEAQQKMMKYMMVFMAFMFYKVPSGLGLYFITSSLWQISERLLLPKVTAAPKPRPETLGDDALNGDSPRPPGKMAKLWEKLLDEAQKNKTYRNLSNEKPRDPSADRDRDRGNRDGRDRSKPRSKPGRRR